jgi:hypothetical protein
MSRSYKPELEEIEKQASKNSPLTLDDVADFVWLWSERWFLETVKGVYIWSDPDYNGDNTIRKYKGTLNDFLQAEGIDFGKGKGKRIIRKYCGDDAKIIDSPTYKKNLYREEILILNLPG